jgi:hypothetical protein
VPDPRDHYGYAARSPVRTEWINKMTFNFGSQLFTRLGDMVRFRNPQGSFESGYLGSDTSGDQRPAIENGYDWLAEVANRLRGNVPANGQSALN